MKQFYCRYTVFFRVGAALLFTHMLLLATGCSVSSTTASAASKKVLVITSSETSIPLADGGLYETGTFLNEFSVPVKALMDAGFHPVFASPKGNKITWDIHSIDKKFFNNSGVELENALRFVQSLDGAGDTFTLDEVLAGGIDRFVGVLIPGGHAPMSDLAKDLQLGELLRHFHEHEKPTALICHGPVALLSALSDPQGFIEAASNNRTYGGEITWPYQGYSMTAFSTEEEQFAEQNQLGGRILFYLDDALSRAGARLESGGVWESHVVKHKELITGRQPFSDAEFSRQFVDALLNYRERRLDSVE